MSLLQLGIDLMERGLLPDALVRAGIRRQLSHRLQKLNQHDRAETLTQFLEQMQSGPVADVPERANEQHYEVPAEFFQLVLGQRLKYSCCLYPDRDTTLDEAEEAALTETCDHADLQDGQQILELGCGWGSLSLWMAQQYPNSVITAVSNSRTQREFILSKAEAQGLHNLTVLTADMNDFYATRKYDRVVSVEMFEHMRNQGKLLRRISTWLEPRGKVLIHVFCHRQTPYLFQPEGEADWMAKYFFTGGMMPSEKLFSHLQADLVLSRQWRWEGTHYERTSNDWLRNMDLHRETIVPLFRETYGKQDARLWWNRWRVFFMACAELFGYRNGAEWYVTHALFEPQSVPVDVI